MVATRGYALLLLGALLGFGTCGHADAVVGTHAVVGTEAVVGGVGIRTCAQFAKDYQSNPSYEETIYANWALGFMSGMNAILDATDKPKRDLAAISFEDKKHFLREYCDGHPLQIYMEGVVQLMRSLPVMRQAQ